MYVNIIIIPTTSLCGRDWKGLEIPGAGRTSKANKFNKIDKVKCCRKFNYTSTRNKLLICSLVSKETEELPEECIPDLPENKEARKFLSHAPSKGLWMPLGKEVKVMKCKMQVRCNNIMSPLPLPTI